MDKLAKHFASILRQDKALEKEFSIAAIKLNDGELSDRNSESNKNEETKLEAIKIKSEIPETVKGL